MLFLSLRLSDSHISNLFHSCWKRLPFFLQCKYTDSIETFHFVLSNTGLYAINKVDINFVFFFSLVWLWTDQAIQTGPYALWYPWWSWLMSSLIPSSSNKNIKNTTKAFCSCWSFTHSKQTFYLQPLPQQASSTSVSVKTHQKSRVCSSLVSIPLAKTYLIAALPASTHLLQLQKSGFPGGSDISMHYEDIKWSVVTDFILCR